MYAVNCAASSDCSVLICSTSIMKFMEVDNIAMQEEKNISNILPATMHVALSDSLRAQRTHMFAYSHRNFKVE